MNEKQIREYAISFCDSVRNDFKFFKILFPNRTSNPEIFCFPEPGAVSNVEIIDGIAEETNGNQLINGFYNATNKSIEIYNINHATDEELKKTIRHECCHFILHTYELPWDDTDEMFLKLATLYDANPWGFYKRPDLWEKYDFPGNKKEA